MLKSIPGYQIKEELFVSHRTVIYRGIRDIDLMAVILKSANDNYPSNQKINQFKYEHYITKKMGTEGVIRCYEKVKHKNNFYLILEDINGISLFDYLQQKKDLDINLFLELAIDITKSLGYIHQKNIIHKDINPSNIVFNERTAEIQIIDFGSATELTREKQGVTQKKYNFL